MQVSAIWAARLPGALPIYPRGATLAATGGEGRSCRVAAVVFSTPIPAQEIAAFYWQRALNARLAPKVLLAGSSIVVQGQARGLALDMRAREADGQTIVELATVTG